MKIGIVGYGTVGKAMHQLFQDAVIYSREAGDVGIEQRRQAINACDLVFVCVPTPMSPDGSCDLSAVREVTDWIEGPVICLKSTVPPGTINELARKTGKKICFSPEYVGETRWHPWKDIRQAGFVIVGGEREPADVVVEAYQEVLGPEARYYVTNAVTAELTKYMENCFYATKVTFVNQFFDLATLFGVDFHELRELWLLDERVGRSHSMVTRERGFSGKCLPKDLSAIIAESKKLGYVPEFLEAVQAFNEKLRAQVQESSRSRPRARLARPR